MQTEDGQVTEPHSISAGLDYPGIGPMHAHLYESGRGTFLSVTDEDALHRHLKLVNWKALFLRLETAHAFSALNQLKLNKNDQVIICLSGRGDKDLSTYMKAMGKI